MKSNEITNLFINLLSNIYCFSFRYDNCMKPNLKLLEPLFLSLNNKNINEITNELELSTFTLNYLNCLINREKEILNQDTFFLKQGFYFGKNSGSIYGDLIHSFENDFIILFGFRLESDESNDQNLIELYNEDKTQVRFFINKDISSSYELLAEYDSGNESQTKINLEIKKTYIFLIQFINATFGRQKTVRIIYFKDDKFDKKGKNVIKYGKEFKIKNFKQDNLIFYIFSKSIY